MRKSLFFILMVLPFLVFSQDDDDTYALFETVMLKPSTKDLATLEANMAAHNKTYHAQGTPYASYVWQIANGPKSGWIIWEMGPCTYSDLDNRPGDEAHDHDWRDNVMPYIDEVGTSEYWRRDDDLSNDGGDNYDMIYVRFLKIAKGQVHRIDDHLKQVSEAVKNMGDGTTDWGVYYNEFRQGDIGRHIATVSGMKSWSELDQDWPFKEGFEKAHGDNAWTAFLQNANEIIEDSYDEIWVLNKKMSGIEE